MARNGLPDPARAGRTADPIELTRAMVAVPSVNPDLEEGAAGEAELAGLCAGWLEGWGFTVETLESAPTRVSVVGRLGAGSPRLILNGHLDTVGVEGMTVDPFDPVVEGDRILGRGSCDMKSGVAAILACAHHLSRAPGELQGELLVVLTCDEEYASVGLRDLLDDGLSADAAVITEPTSLAVAPANRGFFWAHLEVLGRAAHGSRPEVGRDAIRAAGRILEALDVYEAEVAGAGAHPLLGTSGIHAGTIRGGTSPSVYPARCELVLEARTLPGETPDRVLERLEAVFAAARTKDPDLQVRVRPGLYRPGSELPGEHELVRSLNRAVEQEGGTPRVEGMSAWVEAAWFNEAGIPAVCFGPGSIGNAHSADEFVPVGEVTDAARILIRFASGFLGVGADPGP